MADICFWQNHVDQEEDCVQAGAYGKAYLLGGYVGGASSEIDGFDMTLESALNPAATLALAKFGGGGVKSSSKGYILGGGTSTSVQLSAIEAFTFSTETVSTPAATLSLARGNVTGVNSSTTGYALGGKTGSGLPYTVRSEIDGIIFSSESATNPAVTLSVARDRGTGVSSSAKGYKLGGNEGYSPNVYSWEIDGLVYSTETSVDPSSYLSVKRYGAGGVNSDEKGFAMGGFNGSTLNEVDGLVFSTESATNPSVTITGRYDPCGVSSSINGFTMGGSGNSNEIDGILFSTVTFYNPSATLSVGRYAYNQGVHSSDMP